MSVDDYVIYRWEGEPTTVEDPDDWKIKLFNPRMTQRIPHDIRAQMDIKISNGGVFVGGPTPVKFGGRLIYTQAIAKSTQMVNHHGGTRRTRRKIKRTTRRPGRK